MLYTALIEYDSETKLFAGTVPSISGAHSQGETIEELKANLTEVLLLCLEEQPNLIPAVPSFVGLATIEV